MREKIFDENCKCYNGDCMELFGIIPDKSIDFILTDIPYELDWDGGIGLDGDFSTRKLFCKKREDNIIYDFSNGIDYDSVFSQFVRVLRIVNACIFCSNKQIGKIMTWWENRGYVATLLVWDKPNPIPFGNKCYINNLEFIVYVRDKGSTYNNIGYNLQLKTFRYTPPNAKERIHETEKPLDLLRHLLMLHTNDGDTVLDPYAGSFSTALACHDLRRKFVGCEIQQEFFDKAVSRLTNQMKQLSFNF